MKPLSQTDKKTLIKKSHDLHPVVMIASKGLSETVNKEINIALNAHELIKVKVAGTEREERATLLESIAETHQAILLQKIGNIGIFYRKNEG